MDENKELLGVAVPHNLTEELRRFLVKKGILNSTYQFLKERDFIVIPVTINDEKVLSSLLQSFVNYDKITILRNDFKPKRKKPKNLEEYLQNKLPPSLQEYIPKAFDVIGDVVIIEIKEELEDYKNIIGKALLTLFPSVKAVYKKCSAVKGKTRVRELELIAGEKKCITQHLEHGIRIVVDVCNTYFSPRLGEEHYRIATMCKDGEAIADLFTGVGPFPLHIARRVTCKIFAIDINPYAIQCLKRSIKLNKLKGEIIPICADVREAVKDLPSVDRIIMNLPSESHNYIDCIGKISKAGTVIHFYHFVDEDEARIKIVEMLKEGLAKEGWEIEEVIMFQKVRESAPRELQMRVDVKIVPKKQ